MYKRSEVADRDIIDTKRIRANVHGVVLTDKVMILPTPTHKSTKAMLVILIMHNTNLTHGPYQR